MERIEEGKRENVNAEEEEEGKAADEIEWSGRNAQEELADSASSLMMAAAAAAADLDQNDGDLEDNSHDDEGGTTLPTKPLVKKARKLLFRRLRVGVEDGRVFVGKFHCLDKQGNIILYDTLEYRHVPPSAGQEGNSRGSSATAATVDGAVAEGVTGEQRSLGLVLIPARCRTSCHVESSLLEQFSLLSV